MSQSFFEGLGIGEPDINLEVGSAAHAAQTGRMMEGIERILSDLQPDVALVYGDTNSTLAGALAAAKLHIPIAHVEAGIRSFNRRMPEEINRVLTDHLSRLLFAPTDAAIMNLEAEGITDGVVRTGDVMFDLALQMGPKIEQIAPATLRDVGVQSGRYILVTLHRPENTDDETRWSAIMEGLHCVADAGPTVVWLTHPRTAHRAGEVSHANIRIMGPQPYLKTHALIHCSRAVITDSGGLQKEAAFHQRPCITVRPETEWVELVEAGVNTLTETDPHALLEAALAAAWPQHGLDPMLYGDGSTAEAIARHLLSSL
jgi:UDP-GlcNAc3NAcA epimerase